MKFTWILYSPSRFIGLALMCLLLLPQVARAVEKENLGRLVREYDKISQQVAQLSEEFHQGHLAVDGGKVLRLLDKVATLQERVARYDMAHHLTALDGKNTSPEHATLRSLFYAYEAMAQMLSAQVDYQVSKSEPLLHVAQRYREAWKEAEAAMQPAKAP